MLPDSAGLPSDSSPSLLLRPMRAIILCANSCNPGPPIMMAKSRSRMAFDLDCAASWAVMAGGHGSSADEAVLLCPSAWTPLILYVAVMRQARVYASRQACSMFEIKGAPHRQAVKAGF